MSTKGGACQTCHHWRPHGLLPDGTPAESGTCGGGCFCTTYVYEDVPEAHEVAAALAVTSWTCPYPECEADNDVWGEGAVNHWMECQACGRSAWLSLNLGIAEELGLDPTRRVSRG